MERRPQLLIADFDRSTQRLCTRVAESLECELFIAKDRDSMLKIAKDEDIAVALLDATTIFEYLDVTKALKRHSPRIEVLILDETALIPAAVASIKAGAADYLEKPLNEQLLESSISQALNRYSSFAASVVPLDELEKQAIQGAIAQANGDKLEAARLLSIGKTTLYRKLRQYGHERRQRRSKAG